MTLLSPVATHVSESLERYRKILLSSVSTPVTLYSPLASTPCGEDVGQLSSLIMSPTTTSLASVTERVTTVGLSESTCVRDVLERVSVGSVV